VGGAGKKDNTEALQEGSKERLKVVRRTESQTLQKGKRIKIRFPKFKPQNRIGQNQHLSNIETRKQLGVGSHPKAIYWNGKPRGSERQGKGRRRCSCIKKIE